MVFLYNTPPPRYELLKSKKILQLFPCSTVQRVCSQFWKSLSRPQYLFSILLKVRPRAKCLPSLCPLQKHPSIRFLPALLLRWSQSELRATPWASQQFIARPHRKTHNHSHSHSHPATGNLVSPIRLARMFLRGSQSRSHADTGRT